MVASQAKGTPLASMKAEELTDLLRQWLERDRISLAEAGRRLGCSASRVLTEANRLGIHRRRRQRAKGHRQQIRELRMEGVAPREIAARFGIALRTVYTICRDYERFESNQILGVDCEPFTRKRWGEAAEDLSAPAPVKPYRCPRHGLVTFRPCVACMAAGQKSKTRG